MSVRGRRLVSVAPYATKIHHLEERSKSFRLYFLTLLKVSPRCLQIAKETRIGDVQFLLGNDEAHPFALAR